MTIHGLQMNKILSFIVPAFFVLLSACGGDDKTSTAASTSIDRVSKYVGTWKSACFPDEAYVDTTDLQRSNANVVSLGKVTKVSDTELSLHTTDLVYSSQDSSCSGPVYATVIRTGLNTGAYVIDQNSNTLTSSIGPQSRYYTGPASISEAPGADNMVGVSSRLAPADVETIQLGVIELYAWYFSGGTFLSAWYVNGNQLRFGTTVPYDPTQFPNTLSSHFLTKVP